MASRISIRRQFLLFCPLTLPLLASTSTTDTPTTCYVINGSHNSNAGYRCDNSTTGHSSCCQAGAICFSNGVCQQANGKTQDYLRVGCTDPTWKDPACLNQCAIYARGSTAGIRFCNGAITSTTEYCCDTGANGVGSFACCDNDTDIFNISPVATVLAQVPLNYISSSTSKLSSSSSSSSSSSTSYTSSASTTLAPISLTSISSASTSTSISTTASVSNTTATPSPSQTSTTPLPSATSTSHSAAIGAGVGIPCGILALGLLGFFLWRRKREQKADETSKNHEAEYPTQEKFPASQGYNAQSPRGGNVPSERGPAHTGGNLGESGEIGIQDKTVDLAPQPSEMDAERAVHEMDGSHGGGR